MEVGDMDRHKMPCGTIVEMLDGGEQEVVRATVGEMPYTWYTSRSIYPVRVTTPVPGVASLITWVHKSLLGPPLPAPVVVVEPPAEATP